MAYSCDYSMLYYKGQCELYSDLLIQNKTDAILKAGNDLSFCSDPRVGKYIQDHGLTNTPRSPSLIPGYGLTVADESKQDNLFLPVSSFLPKLAKLFLLIIPLNLLTS
jgi:hypothetical protein